MAVHQSPRTVLRLGAPLLAISLLLTVAGTALAGAPSPGTIHVTQSSAMTVDASGTWTWAEMDTNPKLSWTGFAIDWGDTANGNEVGTYHIGDGTAATNVVLQPTDPAQGSSGSFGPVSHTYAKAGTYSVCVIVYDLGEVMPFKTTGYHSLKAGGVGRNTDNSVDQKGAPPVACTSIDLAAATPTPTASPTASPTPTPFQEGQGVGAAPTATPNQEVEGLTANPTSDPTPPTTSSTPDQSSDRTLPSLALALMIGSMIASVFVLKMVRLDR